MTRKYERKTKSCPVCSKNFETIIGNKEERTTCSYSCSNKFFRSGKSNANYKTGISKYRDICFLYYKKECIICGEKNLVDVHHKDCNRDNNDKDNLVPLCPTHHKYCHSEFYFLIKEKVENHLHSPIV